MTISSKSPREFINAGRPRLALKIGLIMRLREQGFGWRRIAQEYEKITGVWISRDTVKRRYTDHINESHSKDTGSSYAPILREADNRQGSYDDSLIALLVKNCRAFRAAARLYEIMKGRPICHKTIKRHYLKARAGR